MTSAIQMQTTTKTCERCDAAPAVQGEKYCKACRKQVLSELKEAGYLSHAPNRRNMTFRGAEARENTTETKHGSGHG